VNRIKVLAGIGAVSVLILGLLAWHLDGNWTVNPDVTSNNEAQADGSNADSQSPLAPAGEETIVLAEDSGYDMALFEDDHILGNPDAPITIIEYASLTCPHCAHFHNDVLPDIKTNYIDEGLARLVFRNFPLDRVALLGAQIANCAPDGSYFRIIEVMFRSQEQWASSNDPAAALEQIGRSGGIAPDTMQACIDDEALVEKILRRAQEAQVEYGLNSTPSFVINGQVVKGAKPYEEFDQIMREMLPKS